MMLASVASWRDEADAREGTARQATNKTASSARRTDVTDMGLSLGTAQPDQGARAFTGSGPAFQCSPSPELLTTRESFAGPQPKGRLGRISYITRPLGNKSYLEECFFP